MTHALRDDLISPVPHVSVVVPVYRSEQCLPALIKAIESALMPLGWNFEVVLVNDYSPDHSWQTIESLCREYPFVIGVDLRRNFGQDNAILTGMRLSRGNFVVVMDDDLQHDPKDIPKMILRAEEGVDVVFADFTKKRQHLWKNLGSWVNGKIAEWLLYKPKGLYLSPYKVVRREVADMICRYAGPTPYIDGLLLQVTWRIAGIRCEHRPRLAGESNYSFWRSLGVSARLIFSFSAKPARLLTWCGLAMISLGVLAGLVLLYIRLSSPNALSAVAFGWVWSMITVLLLSGIETTLFGVVGEYAGRIYLQVTNKPQTSIREVLNRETRGALQAHDLPTKPGGVSIGR